MSATQPIKGVQAGVSPPAPPSASDTAYLRRMPMTRQAFILRVPDRKTTSVGLITVTEQTATVLLAVEDFSGLQRSLQLTLPEARAVADHINKACTRVVRRKDYQP
jgi:hypothetical protein